MKSDGKRAGAAGAAPTFEEGDRVRVVSYPKAPQEDHAAEGRAGRFVEYTRPNGYGRVELDPEPGKRTAWHDTYKDVWLIHPENLVRLPAECDACGYAGGSNLSCLNCRTVGLPDPVEA